MPCANLYNMSKRCWQAQFKFERLSAASLGFFYWCFRQWSCVLNASCSVLLWDSVWSTRPKIEAIRGGKGLSGFMAYFSDSAGFLPLKQCFQMCSSSNRNWSFQKSFPQFLNADHNRKGILYLHFCGFLVVPLIHIKELWLEKKRNRSLFHFSPHQLLFRRQIILLDQWPLKLVDLHLNTICHLHS